MLARQCDEWRCEPLQASSCITGHSDDVSNVVEGHALVGWVGESEELGVVTGVGCSTQYDWHKNTIRARLFAVRSKLTQAALSPSHKLVHFR